MWHNLKIENVNDIKKTVAEFSYWIVGGAAMRIKIYEHMNGSYEGLSNLMIKRKSNGQPEAVTGIGMTIDETLENTIKCFYEMLKEDGITEFSEDDIVYMNCSDF